MHYNDLYMKWAVSYQCSEGLEPNKAYLCQNITEEYEGTDQVRTTVISAVSLLELKPLMDQLGKGILDIDANSPE